MEQCNVVEPKNIDKVDTEQGDKCWLGGGNLMLRKVQFSNHVDENQCVLCGGDQLENVTKRTGSLTVE